MASLLFSLPDSKERCKVHEWSFYDNKNEGLSIALTFKIIYVHIPVSLATMCYFSQTLQHFHKSNFILSLTPYIMLAHEIV